MASMAELEQILGKAVLDEKFRAYLLKEPQAAAGSVCVELSDNQLAAIQQLDGEALTWWAAGLDKLLGKGYGQGFFW